MKTIGAFVPVYKQPKNAVSLARALSSEDYEGSEVIIMVDGETTPEIADALHKIRDTPRVKVIEGMPHWGKAVALYHAVESSNFDNIIVLDNDIALDAKVKLFENCSKLLEVYDLVELPKIGVGKGLVAALVKYEFISNIIGAMFASRKTSKCPSMNGAAFAVRRSLFMELKGLSPVIDDDTDFAARAMLAGAQFAIDPSVRVFNEVPETVTDWLKQRKRWATSFGLWSSTYLRKIRQYDAETLKRFILSSLSFAMPFLTTVLALVMCLIGPRNLGGGIIGITIVVGSFVPFILYAVHFSKVTLSCGQKVNWIIYVIFALIYSPIWAFAHGLGYISVKLNKVPKLDWVYSSSKQGGR